MLVTLKIVLMLFCIFNYNEAIVYFTWFQDKILEELDKEDSTHDSVSPESDSEEDGIRIDTEKALAEKEKVVLL